MPWNGSGGFTRVYNWQADATAGIDIDALRMDTDTDDITSNGFGNTLTRDGQGSATANLPMNGFKHTGVANGVAATDYLAMGQVVGTVPSVALNVTGLEITGTGMTIHSGGMNVTGSFAMTGNYGLTGSITVSGSVQAASGQINGLLAAQNINSVGSVSAASGSITALMQAGSLSSAGGISGATGTIAGLMNVGTLASSGAVTGATGSIAGTLTAGTAAVGTNVPQWAQVVGGIGAAWTVLTGSRALGSTFTNSTGRPIMVSVLATSTGTAQISFTVAGTLTAVGTYATTGVNLGVCCMVPNGATYSSTITAGTPSLVSWLEL